MVTWWNRLLIKDLDACASVHPWDVSNQGVGECVLALACLQVRIKRTGGDYVFQLHSAEGESDHV